MKIVTVSYYDKDTKKYLYSRNVEYEGTVSEFSKTLENATIKSLTQKMKDMAVIGFNGFIVFDEKKKKWIFDFSDFDRDAYLKDVFYDIKCLVRQDIGKFATIEYNGHVFDARQKYFDRYVQKLVLAEHGVVNYPIEIPDENDILVRFENEAEFKSFIKKINDLYSSFYDVGRLIKFGGEVEGIKVIPLSEYSTEDLITTPFDQVYEQIKELRQIN